MSEYITSTDVQNRLTVNGYRFAADRDEDGTVSAAEEAAYVTTAIQYAGELIDGALSKFMDPDVARAAGNRWLKDRCIDIAAVMALENGGREVPDVMQRRHDFSLEQLEQVRDGFIKVPRLTYSRPYDSEARTTAKPQVRNFR